MFNVPTMLAHPQILERVAEKVRKQFHCRESNVGRSGRLPYKIKSTHIKAPKSFRVRIWCKSMTGGGDVQRVMTKQWRALLAMERCAMSNGEKR